MFSPWSLASLLCACDSGTVYSGRGQMLEDAAQPMAGKKQGKMKE